MRAFRYITAAVLAIASSAQVSAESMHPFLDQKHTFLLGGFWENVDAEIFADADSDAQAGIDLGDLGMDEDDNSWMLEYRYRLGEKWLITAGAFTFKDTGRQAAEGDFSFGGSDFEAGVTVDSELQINTYIADIMYKVYSSDRAEIFVGGGLHVFDLSAEIESQFVVGDQVETAERGTSDLLAPLPNLRLQGFYAITSNWSVSGTLGWLSATYGDYDGDFSYVRARTSYNFTDRFGVSLGYQFIEVDVVRDRDRGETGLDASFDGPLLMLSYGF